MKKLLFLSFLFSLTFTACKDDCDCEVCTFHPPGYFVETEYPMTCFDNCYFSYELLGEKYHFSSEALSEVEAVKCTSIPDTCSHIVNFDLAKESFKFTMLRLEDSLELMQSIGKKLPLRHPDSIYWGQRLMSASFELIDNCGNRYYTTNTGFPDQNYVIIDTAIYIGKLSDSIFSYSIIGSFSSEVILSNYSENLNGLINVSGEFNVAKKLLNY